MSRVLENLAVIEDTLRIRHERLAKSLAQEEDTKMLQKHAYVETLSEAQQQVALLRLDIGDKWPQPDVIDSYIFLVSEIGEVGDALLHSNHGHRGDYVRNHPKECDLDAELGDAYLMLCTLATCLDIDLDCALQDCIDKLKRTHDTT